MKVCDIMKDFDKLHVLVRGKFRIWIDTSESRAFRYNLAGT